MPLLSRKKQLSFVEELGAKNIDGFLEGGGSGTAYSPLTTARFASNLVFDAQMNPEVELLDRDFIRDSVSPLKQIAGTRTASLGFTCELVRVLPTPPSRRSTSFRIARRSNHADLTKSARRSGWT